MKITLTRTLPDDTLSVFRIRDMRPDEVIVATCENPAEFNKAKQQAKVGKVTSNRIDGFDYRIVTDSIKGTVTISLENNTNIIK